MPTSLSSRVQSVAEITRSIKVLLENGFAFVAVCGEVSNLKQPYSGHRYFTLKDQDAQLRAVMFKTQQRYLAAEFAEGARVICRGRLSVYEPRGEYQLIVDSVEQAGDGERLAAFERLKEKLYREGLFAEERKRRLPLLPESIALVTSPRGAAIHDFLTVAARRFPSVPIEIYPVPVQGDGAAWEIVAALKAAHRRGRAKVVVICRGGGAVEDFSPFNSEELARAVAKSEIPVVSAIGHEVDFTILDFVADYRAATPTAAAEAVVPDRSQLRYLVAQQVLRQRAVMDGTIIRLRQRLQWQVRLLGDPTRVIDSFRMRIDFLAARMRREVEGRVRGLANRVEVLRSALAGNDPRHRLALYQTSLAVGRYRLRELVAREIDRRRAHLAQEVAILRSVSPMAVLERGYAIVRRIPGGGIVKETGAVIPGDLLSIRVTDGAVRCRVEDAGHAGGDKDISFQERNAE